MGTYFSNGRETNQSYPSVSRLLNFESGPCTTRLSCWLKELGAIPGELRFEQAKMILCGLLPIASGAILRYDLEHGISPYSSALFDQPLSILSHTTRYGIDLLLAISSAL